MNREKRTVICLISAIKHGIVYLSAIILTFLSGCNKTDEFEDLNLLTEKNWQLTSIVQGGIDITDDCDLDDLLIFEDATQFNYDYGILYCIDNDIAKAGDTYKIIEDFTVLRMKYKINGEVTATLIEYWKITELSETSLIIEDASAEGNDQIPEIRIYQN